MEQFTCNNCQETFSDKQCLNQHMHAFKDGCNLAKEDELHEKLTKVLQKDTVKNATHIDFRKQKKLSKINPLLCTLCQLRFQTQEELVAHTCSHDSEAPPVKLSKDLGSQATKNLFECSLCCKNFSHLQKNFHFCHGKKQFLCFICKKVFVTKEDLATHPCSLIGQKLLVCDFCHEGFKSNRDLSFHVCAHTEKIGLENLHKNPHSYSAKKPFVCNVCDKKFSRHESLSTHICEGLYRCHMCQNDFPTEESLTAHLCGHASELICDSYKKCPTDEQNGKQLEDSNKNLRSRSARKTFAKNRHNKIFTRHQSSSTRICKKSYQCHMCQVKFSTEKNLYAHLRTHVKELE